MKFFITISILCLSLSVFSQEQFSVYFETNKFELNQKESIKLTNWILANKTSKIVAINGYTDEVGSAGYNDTLASKRVQSIFEKVKINVAIREDFKTLSVGENFKQSEIKSENRRATIYYILEKDIFRENEILGIEEEVIIPEDATFEEKIALSKVGAKIILKNINFYQNTFAITPESNGSLYDLLFVMQNNPNLKIQIQGHICCIDLDRRKLSLERAKQVRRWLVYQRIPQYRITVTGFGTTQPIYAIPEENEEQAAANRRVEIEILSK
jgi:outer membrane protein OmpA-like peptidoglycan-associated protein